MGIPANKDERWDEIDSREKKPAKKLKSYESK